jgi:hypothetical protein
MIHDTVLQMTDQVRQWLEYASYILPKPEGKTLTTWWAGINDCSHMLNNATVSRTPLGSFELPAYSNDFSRLQTMTLSLTLTSKPSSTWWYVLDTAKAFLGN